MVAHDDPAKDRELFDLFVEAKDVDWNEIESARGGKDPTARFLADIDRIRAAFEHSAAEAAEDSAVFRNRLEPAGDADASTQMPSGEFPHISGYEIIDEIGSGGFARIYKARDVRSERIVAVKLLRRRLGLRPEAVARFLREARALARLNHPSIVRIYHVIEEDELLGLSMEYIDGHTLREVLDEETCLSAREVASAGLDLCEALDAVNGAGFVHRDIKPENVMREEGGRIVLMDFGLTRSFDTDSKLTGTGILVGTPLAMAPEQYEFKEVDARTDLYALGSLLYRLATGSCHVEGSTMQEIRDKVLSGNHAPVELLRSDFPPSLARIIAKSMETDPHRRYSSAAKMKTALANWIEFESGERRSPRNGGFRPVIVLLSVILALLLGILAFVIYLAVHD